MHSTEKAQVLIRGIGDFVAPEMPAKVRYSKIFHKLVDLLPGLTMRRVRAMHNGEIRRVDPEEIDALEKLRAIEEARNEHRHFVAYTNKLVALHAAGATSLSRQELALLSRVASRPDIAFRPAETHPRRNADRALHRAGAANANSRTTHGRDNRARAA